MTINYAYLPGRRNPVVGPDIHDYRSALSFLLAAKHGRSYAFQDLHLRRWRRLIRLRRWMDETLDQRGPGGALP